MSHTGDGLLMAVVLFDINYTFDERPPLLKDHFLVAFEVVINHSLTTYISLGGLGTGKFILHSTLCNHCMKILAIYCNFIQWAIYILGATYACITKFNQFTGCMSTYTHITRETEIILLAGQ